MKKYKVGILQINPHTLWRQGGGEIHANKYIDYGNTDDVTIEKFDFKNPWSYDLIHFFGSGYQMNDMGRYARKEGIKVVGTPILYPAAQVKKYKMFLRFGNALPFPTTLNLRQELLLNADLLIANSKPEAVYLSNAYGVPPSRLAILGTGVDEAYLQYDFSAADLPAFAKAPQSYVLMVGRVTPLKNQLTVASIFEKENKFPLIIVGQPDISQPEYIASLRKIIESSPHIHWIEGLSANDARLKALYANAICHILWSDTEVAALVNMEAAACGCPVLSRNLATTVDIMQHHGIFAKNEKELLQQVLEISNWNNEKRTQVKNALKLFVKEKYTWQKIVAASLSLYRTLLEK